MQEGQRQRLINAEIELDRIDKLKKQSVQLKSKPKVPNDALSFKIRFDKSPIGLILKGNHKDQIIIIGFDLDPKPIHLSSLMVGDEIVGINNVLFDDVTHDSKMNQIQQSNWPLILNFCSSNNTRGVNGRILTQKSMDSPTTKKSNAATIIQSYVRMSAAQNEVLYSLYKSSEKSLEQSLLNMMIHHDSVTDFNSIQPHDQHRDSILKQHEKTAFKRTQQNIETAQHYVHRRKEFVDLPEQNIDHIIEMFQRCVKEAIGMDHYDNSAIRHLFVRADTNGDGYISNTELHRLFYNLDFCLTTSEITVLFNWIDFDGDGNIDLDEFIEAIGNMNQNIKVHVDENNLTEENNQVEEEECLAAHAMRTRVTHEAVNEFLKACESGNIAMLDNKIQALQILEKDTSNLRSFQDGWTPMHFLAFSGSLQACCWMINNGGTSDDEDRYGVRPIMIAAREGYLEICKMLYEDGADVFGNGELSPKAAAKLGHHDNVLEWLKKMGV